MTSGGLPKEANDRLYGAIFRGVVIGGGLLGFFAFARSTRLFAKYERVSQIPPEVYQKGIALRGIVRSVHSNGYMQLEHKPIIKMPSFFYRRKHIQPGLLDIRLAGIDISSGGLEYLMKDLRLRSKHILFNAIRPVENKSCVDAEVFFKKKLFLQTNLNVDLVRRGFAQVKPLTNEEHLEAVKTNPLYSRMISKLIMAEKVADRRGLGLWTRDTWAETISSYPTVLKQIVCSAALTRFVVSVAITSKKMFYRGSHIAKRALEVMVPLSYSIYLLIKQSSCMLWRLGNDLKKKFEKS